MNKGFISLSFLLVFVQITALLGTLLLQLQTRLLMMERMQKVHFQISQEALLIDYVNCRLASLQPLEPWVNIHGQQWEWIEYEDRIEVIGSNGEFFIFILDSLRQRIEEIEFQ